MSTIPAGYKQTEVGVIPEDWEVTSFSQVMEIGDGLHGTPKYSETGMFFFINGNNLDSGKIWFFKDTKKVDESELKKAPIKLTSNSILLSINGTIGKCALYQNEPVMLGKSAAFLTIRGDCVRLYVYYILQSRKVTDFFFDSLTGSTIKNLGLNTIRSTIFPLPPLPEQKRIAQVLGDVDALIQKLEALIAKKRDIKQATMQELLTGKRRLPGFSGAWETKKLGEICSIFTGKSKTAYITLGGDFIICDMGSVSVDGRLISSKRTNYSGDFLDKGDLVMPKDDIGGGKIIGRVAHIDCSEQYVLSDHVYRLRTNTGDPLYLLYSINSSSINTALGRKVIGSAQLGLSRKSVEDQMIPFPSHPEQTAIAQVLSDMDAELEKLETRLAKTRDLKAGLMRELLTGRIRLRVAN